MENRVIKILAVDDNNDNLITLKALINDAFPGAIVLKALRGKEALLIAKEENLDVIILDVVMPEMDGFEVCTRLKADVMMCDIPVIFVTAIKGDKESRIRALECGAEAFLSKPIDESELTAQIRAMLKIRESNIRKHDEAKYLNNLVEEKTKELKAANEKTLQLLEDVKKEQSLIESIFDSIPGYLYVYDENGKLIKWNKKYEIITGYTSEELSHMTLDKWFDQDDLLKVTETIKDVFKNGYGEGEANLILKNGDKRLTRFNGVPLIMNGSKYFTGIGIDITEQRKLQDALLEHQAILKAAFENSQAGIIIADAPDGKIRYVNKAGYKIRGKSEEDIVTNVNIENYVEMWNIRHLDETPYEKKNDPLARSILYGETSSEEHIVRRDDLEDRYVLSNSAPIRDANNNIIAGIVVFLDITDRKLALKTLVESERKYSSYIENSPDGVFVIDNKGRYIDVNKAGLELTGYSREELLSMDVRAITAKDSFYDVLKLFRKILATGSVKGELKYIHKNGTIRWWSIDAVRLNKNSYLGFSSDITERKKVESELFYLSYHDHLTDLYNRRFFEQELKRLDNNRNLPFSIIMCDVNGLKLVNDSFGHDVGDTLLKKTANTIKSACRKGDTIARIGGDEFVVLLPKTTAEEAVQIANNIKELALKENVVNIELSISCGYDTKTTENKSILETIANAENHMYRHKLYERSSVRSKTIELIMDTLFEKSTREAEHSQRVSGICEAIAAKMNFSKDGINQMRIAGLIHDIGKIGVSEKILNKPGGLTIDERRDVERHPEIGWRLLSSTNEFSELAQFVLNHHEKWDGSGYPNGLKGEEITIEARIISVADAYDAMTSERSYRTALTDEEVIKELNRCAGTQFDPKIVNIFTNQVLAGIKI